MHKNRMQEALSLAWLGRGICSPNPSVGAVIAREGKILAKGWHAGAGKSHAEQIAINNAETDLQGATMYVTLEPCNHWGKTPPCVEAIIASGITQVVYGFKDPNPIVCKNATPQKLKQHGIHVIHQPSPEIDAFYESYAYWMQHKQPWVTVKIAQTLDGKIAANGNKPVQLSNASCDKLTHQHRWHADVILTTAQTVLDDNPALDARLNGQHRGKTIAVLDRNLRLTGKETFFSKAAKVILFHREDLQPPEVFENCCYVSVEQNNACLNLRQVLQKIGGLGYHDLWVEAGGRLFTALHQAQLVNRTLLYIVPDYLGNGGVDAFHSSNWLKQAHVLHWQEKGNNMLLTIDWQEY